MNYSPLRYPGGKSKLYDIVLEIMEYNNLLGGTYVEPFAGGSGLAIKLLLNKKVKRIILNDKDPAIYSFWYAILNQTNEFCKKIDQTPITIQEWEKQKKIFLNGSTNVTLLDYAFAVFFLNRTNVSGILKGGVIGGHSQNGKYKINARFNKENLKAKIRNIADQKDKIEIFNLDANDFINADYFKNYKKVFINFDPPYVNKGSQLYMNFFNESDHINLFQNIRQCKKKWIVTYDKCELINKLYKNYKHSLININYSVKEKKKAEEYMFFSKNINIPNNDNKGANKMINNCNDCRFCSIQKGIKTFDTIDTPIMETDKFFLLSSIGSLVEGWTMVIPKNHCYSMKEFYTQPEFQQFVNDSVSKLSNIYKDKKIIAFEHGANKFGSLTACGTNHAHIHLVPIDSSLLDDIQKHLSFDKISIDEISNHISDNEYLLYIDIEKTLNSSPAHIHILEKPISQFFRKIIAEKLGNPEKYNYKEYLNKEISEATIKAFKSEE